jgi:hypothetical protein
MADLKKALHLNLIGKHFEIEIGSGLVKFFGCCNIGQNDTSQYDSLQNDLIRMMHSRMTLRKMTLCKMTFGLMTNSPQSDNQLNYTQEN